MKLPRLFAVLALSAAAASAQTTHNYPDATGEIAVAIGGQPHLDITSVDVTVDASATTLTFVIHLAGDPVATNWGKYMVGIRSNPGGTTSGNGWGRPIHFAGGMTHWIGCWVDGGNGGEVWSYNGAWSRTDTAVVTKDTSSVTIATPVAALNLSPGETFSFDVYTSGGGGGDSAVDALSLPTTSISNWTVAFTTAAAGAPAGAAPTFTMPGTADFATWIAGFGRTGNDALPGTDYDADGLTNQQEFDLDLGLDPTVADSDNDGLLDGVETLDGHFVDAAHTGTNPMDDDTDGDGLYDGGEVDGSLLSYVSDPNHHNYDKIVVAGTFNLPTAWDPAGVSVPVNAMTMAGNGLTQQFQWTLDQHLATPKQTVSYKFTAGAWTTSWGAGASATTAVPNGGNIDALVVASGIYRFRFDTVALTHDLSRLSFADQAAFLAAYGLGTDTAGDADGDGVTNGAEFTANTDPLNADTDGDGLGDATDPEPLVPAPETRTVVFQVNMSVATTQGIFTPGVSTVRVTGQFVDWNTAGGVVLTDPDADGIYTGSYGAGGFQGVSFGGYKFFIDGGPNNGYENGDNRSFNLGPDGVDQVLPVVYFSGAGPGGFDAWIAGYTVDDATRTGDPDHDGLSNETEFLFGTPPDAMTGALATLDRQAGGLHLVWLQRSEAATYVLEENDDLADAWTASPLTPAAAADQTGAPAGYTRMEVLLPLTGARNFLRINGTAN